MHVILKPPETERKKISGSVRRAGKSVLQTRTGRVRSLICPHSGALAQANAAPDAKHLISGRDQAILPSSGKPFGECLRPGNTLRQTVARYFDGKSLDVGRRPLEAPLTLPDCSGLGTHKAEAA